MKPEVVENCGLKTSSFYGSGHEQNGQDGNFGTDEMAGDFPHEVKN